MTEQVTFEQLLDILCAFDGFCRKGDILYSLHGGTLLGAIREKNFIPWDDDADVSMTRANYQKLLALVSGETSEYCIRGRIKKQFYSRKNPNVWVDIFICDYITDNPVLCKLKLIVLTVLDIMNRNRESYKFSNLQKYSPIKRLAYKLVYVFGQTMPKRWIAGWYHFISERCFLGNRQQMFRSNDQYAGRLLCFPAIWMEHYKQVPFSNCELSVLEDHDALLRQCYGEEYMIPVRDDRNVQVHNWIRAEKEINL